MKVKEFSQETCSLKFTNMKGENSQHSIHIKKLVKELKLRQNKAERRQGKNIKTKAEKY